jgi:hypothetical protein
MVAIGSLIFMYSCEEKQITYENEYSLVNTQLEGVANFSSQQQFDYSIESLKNTGLIPEELSGVTSLNQSVKLKSSESDSEETDTLIYSDLLRDLLNEKYEIIVGNVFFKITEKGTFFTTVDHGHWLSELNTDISIVDNCEQTSNALGYSIPNGIYKINGYENLYFYDTYRVKDPIIEAPINLQVLKSATFPSDYEWEDIGDGSTLVGKAWDAIWGFAKSETNYFDSDHRVDVKFYAQRFPFYSEMGIKTKMEKKGWTGLWRGQDCNEIINGWEILNLSEKWSSNFFGPTFNPTNMYLPDFNYPAQTVKNLEYNQSIFLDKTWRTFNLMGLEIDFSQKQKVGELWNVCKSAGKTTVKFLNNRFTNTDGSLDAVRLIPTSSSVFSTKLSMAPYYENRVSTDKYTMIIANSSGGVIGVNFNNWSTFGWGGYTNLSAKYTFLQNSIMYGAAKRGDIWRGVRITFN